MKKYKRRFSSLMIQRISNITFYITKRCLNLKLLFLTLTCRIKICLLEQTAQFLCCVHSEDSSRLTSGHTSKATGKQLRKTRVTYIFRETLNKLKYLERRSHQP